MQEVLTNKLHQYISENNPDLLLAIEEKGNSTQYLSNKVNEISYLISELQESNTPEYVIEELCMRALTKDFRPSKYNYIKNILEEDFEFAFYNLEKSGTLLYEVVNIINLSEEVFQAFDLNEENEDNRQLRYAITGIISEYLSK